MFVESDEFYRFYHDFVDILENDYRSVISDIAYYFCSAFHKVFDRAEPSVERRFDKGDLLFAESLFPYEFVYVKRVSLLGRNSSA